MNPDGFLVNSAYVIPESSLESNRYDGILLVAPNITPLDIASRLEGTIRTALQLDPSLESELAVLPLPDLPAKRLIYSPTGKLDPDYDDVRSFTEAALKGVKRALAVGIKKLLVVLENYPNYQNTQLVTLLGVLEGIYAPLFLRESKSLKAQKLELIGVLTDDDKKTAKLLSTAYNLEQGRTVCRDIAGGDPEQMSPINVQRYVEHVFADAPVKITIVSDLDVIAREYPLFEAVNRAASLVSRHRGRIMYLEYEPPEEVVETLLLVGKGVTYDTGGADIKAGGIMAGMSRDKSGAAAAAGFMKTVSLIRPKNLKVVCALSLVRNSVGSNCYVADEIITSRSGAIVRVGNTDAEGRMIMADVLCKMKEIAINSVNPHLFTIATLTGHAYLNVGPGYTIVLDNGPAREVRNATKLQNSGHAIGDPLEISTVRKEDFAFHAGKTPNEDILQANNLPSSRTPRGHQGPAAFLILASGLKKHGSGDEKPLKYSHLDIAASSGDVPNNPTGAPILALANMFLLQQ